MIAARRGISWTRIADAVIVLLLLFFAYELFVAPRFLNRARIYPAPRVTYAMLNGTPFVLHAQRGHVVFLDFWASWCEPCRLSLPLVEHFARTHPDAKVVAVNFGEPRNVAASYARTHDLQNVALDPRTLSQGFFGVNGLPTMIVIDPQGRVRASWTGLNPAIALRMLATLQNLSRESVSGAHGKRSS